MTSILHPPKHPCSLPCEFQLTLTKQLIYFPASESFPDLQLVAANKMQGSDVVPLCWSWACARPLCFCFLPYTSAVSTASPGQSAGGWEACGTELSHCSQGCPRSGNPLMHKQAEARPAGPPAKPRTLGITMVLCFSVLRWLVTQQKLTDTLSPMVTAH